MKEQYGNNIPMDEKVISPTAMFNSDKLITVKEEWRIKQILKNHLSLGYYQTLHRLMETK